MLSPVDREANSLWNDYRGPEHCYGSDADRFAGPTIGQG